MSVKDRKTLACLRSAGKPDHLNLEMDSQYLMITEIPLMAYSNGEEAAQLMGSFILVLVVNLSLLIYYCDVVLSVLIVQIVFTNVIILIL